MKNLLILFIPFLTLFSSCTKYSFMSMEEKIVGSWDFEEVKYKKGFFSKSKEVTDDYKNLSYIFEENGDFSVLDKTDSSIFSGKWTITIVSNSTTSFVDEEATTTTTDTYILNLSVYNPHTSDLELMTWEINSIGPTRLKAYKQEGKSTWYYTLSRN